MTETEAREFLNRYFHAAMQGTDLDAFTALFAEDGALEDPVGTPPLVGRAAIREFLAAGRSRIDHSVVEVHEVKVCGDEVATRWSGVLHTLDGRALAIDGIGVFTFAGPQLRRVREFWDVGQLARLFAAS